MSTTETVFELFQKGFRVSVGAAATFVETIQDPLKREVTLSEFRTELENRTEEWSAKGEMTEQEARKFLETIFQKGKSATTSATRDVEATTIPDDDLQSELKALTEEIVTLKSELAALRQEKDTSD